MKLISKQALLSITSLSCCIHCIFTPILITLFPFLSKAFHFERLELGLLGISIICGIYIIYSGYCKHKKKQSIVVYALGALLWISHLFIESIFTFHTEILLITLGSIFVIMSYIINHNFLKCCPTCCEPNK